MAKLVEQRLHLQNGGRAEQRAGDMSTKLRLVRLETRGAASPPAKQQVGQGRLAGLQAAAPAAPAPTAYCSCYHCSICPLQQPTAYSPPHLAETQLAVLAPVGHQRHHRRLRGRHRQGAESEMQREMQNGQASSQAKPSIKPD